MWRSAAAVINVWREILLKFLMKWLLLADAKNKFSEVVRCALTEDPQRIRRRNDADVIVSPGDCDGLTGQNASFAEFLISGPSLEGLDLKRDTSPMRDVAL